MAGIKISQLPKWGITEIEQVDAADILIPVSIDNVTGCLKANTLVNLLKNTPSDIDATQNNNIDNLNERLLYLSAVLDNFMAETNRKLNEIVNGGSDEENNDNENGNENSEFNGVMTGLQSGYNSNNG